MRVAVFGATGGIGSAAAAALLAAGHEVTALVRDPARLDGSIRDRITVVPGALPDPVAIRRTVAGAAAVIWAVGPTANAPDQPQLFESAAQAIVEAARAEGVDRVVVLSGAGVTMPGERKPILGRLVSRLVALVVPHVVATKEREAAVFTRSSLDWTLVRPPRVVAGPASGNARLAAALRGGSVTQGDVGTLLAGLVTGGGGGAWSRRAPYVCAR